MSEALVRGVIVAHADLAGALVGAVRRIAGAADDALVAVSNEGLGPDAIRDRLEAVLGDAPAIVFSDLHDGSCGLAARRVCLGRADRRLVTGANLPMLLDFVLNRSLPLDELVDRVLARGRGAINAAPTAPTG